MPLIDQVTNRWQEKESTAIYDVEEAEQNACLSCNLEEDPTRPNTIFYVLSTRRNQYAIIIVVTIALMTYFTWARCLGPYVLRDWELGQGFALQHNGTYGLARGGDGKHMPRLHTLDAGLLPGGESDPHGKRRLVFIGDVHGCKEELVKLLKKVDFREETDHLVLVGDVVSKGPDNVGVLEELIRLGATSVRGNHEDRLLTAATSIRSLSPASTATSSKGAAKDDALLRQLEPRHLDFLRTMPLILHIPALPMALPSSRRTDSPIAEHILVVHAGLVAGVPLARQDPYFVMNMRSIDHKTLVPSTTHSGKKGGGKPWTDVWNWYNDRLFRKGSPKGFTMAKKDGVTASFWSQMESFSPEAWTRRDSRPPPQVVIYGHDSKTGLQINRWSKGLDTACVAGGELTAFVLDAKGRHELVSVQCNDYKS